MPSDLKSHDRVAQKRFWATYQHSGKVIADYMGVFSMSLACFYVACITLNIFMRYVFNAPMAWVSDMGFICLPLIMAPCLGVSAARGMLIVITMAGDRLSPANQRRLSIAARSVTVVFFGIIAWKMVGYGFAMLREHRSTMQLEIPLGPVWFAVALAFVLAVPLVLAHPLEQNSEARDG